MDRAWAGSLIIETIQSLVGCTDGAGLAQQFKAQRLIVIAACLRCEAKVPAAWCQLRRDTGWLRRLPRLQKMTGDLGRPFRFPIPDYVGGEMMQPDAGDSAKVIHKAASCVRPCLNVPMACGEGKDQLALPESRQVVFQPERTVQ